MELKRCANCAISLKSNTVAGSLGILKSGEEICQHCWHSVLRLDNSKGPDMKMFTLEDIVYKLSSFKKSVHRRLLEANLISGESDRIVPGEQKGPVHIDPDKEMKGQENCAHCLKSLKQNKVFLGLGKLKSGELVCEECWLFLCRLESSMSNRLKEFSLADVKKIFDVVHSRYTPPESGANTEETPEPDVYGVSQMTDETDESSRPAADNLLQPTPEIIEPVRETRLPDSGTLTSRMEARLAAIGATRKSYSELWLVERLEEELESVLGEEERLVAVLKGTYAKEHAALIATNRQFILLSKKTFGGATAETYELEWIQSLEHTVVGALSDVSFRLSSGTLTLTDAESQRALLFSDIVKPLLAG